MSSASRLAVLRLRAFRRFFIGYCASLLGSSMASIAVTFAVLRGGGGGTELGWVMAARILPLVAMLLVGGVVGDRLGSRRVMITADVARVVTQAGLAVALAERATGLGVLLPLVVMWGAAEALFTPALTALVPAISDDATLNEANALLGMARSTAAIAGPVLAGAVIAAAGPAPVLVLDAASYAMSAFALFGLPPVELPLRPATSFLTRLREGWGEFGSRTWLWVTTACFSLFNLLVWAPFLVLGPVEAQARLGGSSAYGLMMAAYGAGAVIGGALLLGRRPRRPLLVATAAGTGWALPSSALACGLPLAGVCAATLLAGVGSAVCGSLYGTVTQRQIPPGARARVGAYTSFGAYVLGPIGLAAAGPLASLSSARHVLAFGAAWQLASTAVVLLLPAVRSVSGEVSSGEVPTGEVLSGAAPSGEAPEAGPGAVAEPAP
ncbi:MFS transporter [Streptomyces sp. SL13]|uniref:MFS transporter n=1 Tax=Streptantibioticus silvisoli TaxID=2705255 RepID=A0AA90HAY2_9ACTN|nr:MFS transporter [Streptantibioticus silvisoli]MDI5971377.1 MFS transporter [Streptantibioticus silvisoli]